MEVLFLGIGNLGHPVPCGEGKRDDVETARHGQTEQILTL